MQSDIKWIHFFCSKDDPLQELNTGNAVSTLEWWWQGTAFGELLQQLEKWVLIRLVGWWFPK
jgi:hypothetical protein